MPHRVPLRTLWRTLIRFESQKIVPQIAVRNAIGFSLAVILGTLAVSPSTGAVAALGALNVSLSDGLDPYRFRARRMLLSSLLTGVAVVAGALSAHNNTAAVIVAAASAFGAGMLVALGTTAADLGVVTVVTVVVFAAKPLPWAEAAQAGVVAACGGLIQTLLSTFLWPLRRYEPERRILSQVYATLADVAQAPPEGRNAPPMTAQITDAQDALAPLSRDHSVEAERHVFLLAQAERIRLSVLNAGRLQRRIARHEEGAEAAAGLQKILGCGAGAIRLVGDRISEGETAVNTDEAIAKLTGCLMEFEALRTTAGSSFFAALLRDARRQSIALRSQIRAAASAAAAKDNYPGAAEAAERPADSPSDWRLRFQGYRARLLANLSLDSTVFRHAVRMAVCLAIGDIIGRAIVLQRTYWIPMTIAIVLKPDFTSTFARGALRIGGTIVGLVFATLLFHVIHTGVATDIALMAAFTLLLRWAGPANYGIFVFAVSGLVVLLIAVTGVAPANVIAARAMNTMLGGMLALVAYAVWPTWESTQTRAALAEMLAAYREYTRAVLGAWQGASRTAINDVRLKGRRARSNAQASVERMVGEPGITERQTVALNTILVHSHSFVHAMMAMESNLYRARREAAPAWMPAFAASADTALDALIGRVRSTPAGAKRLKIDVEIPAPGTAGNEITEIEADRVRVSLRSLAEEISEAIGYSLYMPVIARYAFEGGKHYGLVDGGTVRELRGGLFDTPSPTGREVALSQVKLLAPCEPPKMLAVGLNYRSHLGSRPVPQIPGIFYKPISSIQNPGDPIVIPEEAQDVHYEGELVVVIGKKIGKASREEAAAAIFGVTCGNDVSDRNWQRGDGKDLQWWRAKGCDTFSPFGPYIVTNAIYGDLALETRLNGEKVQSQRTSDLIFDIPEVVRFISQWVTLVPGDLIFTGTPGQTKRMKPGDVVEVELESVGTLRNPVA